jgi:predicted phosphatase
LQIQKEIHDILEQIDVLQKQSINLFDHSKVYKRAFQLLEVLDAKIHELNRQFESPNPEENQILQNLFFNVKKMQDLGESLKLNPQKLQFQQDFIIAIDHIKEDLNRIY